MASLKDIWYCIINPTSGNWSGGKLWLNVYPYLSEKGIEYKAKSTEHCGHAIEITKKAIAEGYRKIICIGGDGTLNEVVNGIMEQTEVPTQDVTVGMLSVGTGNDWVRTHKLPKYFRMAIDVFKAGNTMVQDVGLVSYKDDNQPKQRYYCNAAGVGFDAFVLEKLQKGGGKKSGMVSYLLQVVKSLFGYENKEIKITANGKTIHTKSIMTIAGICKFAGGGMMFCPNAIPNDGKLDVVVGGDFSKFDVIRKILSLYSGSFIKFKKVETFKTDKLTIEAVANPQSVYTETDGELLGTGPFEFSVVPSALKVFVN